jgi:mRNA interferase MazF
MPTTTIYERLSFDDVVLVPFPFTDQTATKQRPAVVISSHALNSQRLDIIVMAVTSQLKPSAFLGQVTITECQLAGLLKPSVVKPVAATIENTLVRKKLGQLQEKELASLREVLALILR